MKKRGQAFIITTIILAMILISFIAIINFSKRKTFTEFYSIAEEIQIESEKVMDYSLINPEGQDISKFTEDISKYLGKDIKIYFIEGDFPSSSNCYSYIYDDEGSIKQQVCGDLYKSDTLTLTLEEIGYSFPTYPKGKHFYFLIIKEEGGEKYVYSNA